MTYSLGLANSLLSKDTFFLSARGKHLLVDRGHVLSFSCLSAFKGKPCCQKVQSVSTWSCCTSRLLSGTFRLHRVSIGLRTPSLHGQFLLLCFLNCLWFFGLFLPLWHGVGTAVTHHSVHCGATGFHSSHSGKFHCTTAQLRRPASPKRPEAPRLSTHRPALFCKRYRFRFVDAPNRKSNTHTVRWNDIVWGILVVNKHSHQVLFFQTNLGVTPLELSG